MQIFKSLFNKKNTESFCPHCKNKLNKQPERKKKCPFCKNFIFVRTDPYNNKKILVSEREAKKIDIKWEEKSRVKKWLNLLLEFEINKNKFDTQKNTMIKNSKQVVKDIDVIWALLNKLNSKYIKQLKFQEMSRIYYNMSLFLGEEGKDFTNTLKEASKMKLLSIKKQGVGKKIKILTGGEKSCEHCQKLKNKIFTIEEAINKQPLPCKECNYQLFKDTKGFCRCDYIEEIEI